MQHKIYRYADLDSTNNEAERFIKKGDVEEGSVFVAEFQHGGRGQGSNSWLSNKANNLLFSIVLKPAFLSAMDQFYLSKVVSLAICDYLQSMGIVAQIKWPNDILISNKKIAGILIENRILGKELSFSIAGVGLNVNQNSFPSFPWEAGSLIMFLGKKMEVAGVLEVILEHLTVRYNQLENMNFEKLDQDFQEYMYKRDKTALFSGPEGNFQAKAIGVSGIGEIKLEKNGIIQSYGFHEVRYAPPE